MNPHSRHSRFSPKPSWIRVPVPTGKNVAAIRDLKRKKPFHTVCEAALCPNIGTCWGAGQATFMILGNGCTRNCSFCAVNGRLQSLDPAEPLRVAQAVTAMELKHAVITSVTRDDLSDGGASVFAEVIASIHNLCPETSVEVLIPDFQGSRNALDRVLDACPDILGHNMETVSRLYSVVRPGAAFSRSLNLLKQAKAINPSIVTKSGLMVGLGETRNEIVSVFDSLRAAGVDILTIGQYLRPGPENLPVSRYYHPDEFLSLKFAALEMGFLWVESGPLVRSSFQAEKQARFFKRRKKDISHAAG